MAQTIIPKTLKELKKLVKNVDVADIDTCLITDMNGLFEGTYRIPCMFNQPLNEWDVSNVTNMVCMFHTAKSFNQPLNDWDVSNVTYMRSMFVNATSFNQPLNDWDVSKVTYADYMFKDAKRYTGSMSNWDFKKINKKPECFMKGCISWRMYNSYKDFPSFNGKTPRKLKGVQTIWHKL